MAQKQKFEMTITPELFAAWSKLKRRNDTEELMAILGKSYPVIGRALKYGYVKDQKVIDGITKFLEERFDAEAETGKELLSKVQ